MELNTSRFLKQLSDDELQRLISECWTILHQRRESRSKDSNALVNEIEWYKPTGARITRTLAALGIVRISDLANYTRRQIESQRQWGRMCSVQLDEVMCRHNVKYKDESF